MPNATDVGDEPTSTAPLPLLEEHAKIAVREVVTGRVRVSTRVETFEEIATAALASDTVEVTRVPVGTPVTGSLPQLRTEGDLTIVPVFEEVLVVEKRLMLKEEVHIRRRSRVDTVDVPVSLRRQTASVEQIETRES